MESSSVSDAGVIQLVADNVVFRPKDRRHGSRIGCESRLEYHARLYVLECGDALFELHVQGHGAGNRPHRSRADAELAHRLQRCLAQFGMRGQPKIIVGRQVDHLPAVEARFRRTLGLEHAQPLEGSLGAPLIDLFVKVEKGVGHDCYK
jgi:hypothetical protein